MKKIILILSILTVIASCKKDKTTPKEEQQPEPVALDTEMSPSAGKNLQNLSGVFLSRQVLYTYYTFKNNSYDAVINSTTKSSSDYLMPFIGGIKIQGDHGGTLLMNADTMKFASYTNTNVGSYFSSIGRDSDNIIWTLNAKSPYTSFSTDVKRGFPVFASLNFLPSTISKSTGLTIYIKENIANADSLYLSIEGPDYKGISTLSAGNASRIELTPDLLNYLDSGIGKIEIRAANYSNQTINGKHYLFVNYKTLLKNQVTIN